MAHEIETNFYSGEVPWHGLGVYVGDDAVDSKTAITAAGLDWNVDTKEIFFKPEEDSLLEIPKQRVVYRTTDNKAFGIVTDRYKPVQNTEAFSFMDSLVNDGSIKYHTAGSLRGGKNIWILAKIGSVDILPNDQVDKYLLLYNSHDGSGALRCFFTTIRVVCANTASIALSNGKKEGLYLRHTSRIIDHTIEAKNILKIANAEFDEFERFAKLLSNTTMTDKMMIELAEKVFPEPDTTITSTTHQDKRDNLVQLFYNGIGQDISGVRGTAWAAYNALVEYSNYHSPGRGNAAQERRFESSVLLPKNSILFKGIQELYRAAA